MTYRFEPLKMEQPLRRHLRMGGSAPSGEKIEVTSRCIERGGKPWLPVMGEYHFVRDQKENWYRELCKMKAGGIDIVATYVIWIYHEEREGIFDFTGDRDLRAFVEAAQKAGLDVLLRIGPWVHGECRNGGFPDWLLEKPFPLRKSNAGYMELVRQWYGHIYKEVQGLFYKDGGNIIGIQVENELTDDAQHLLDLKKLAVKIGFEVPLYTVTGWNSLYGAKIPVDDVLPVFGAYVDAPWADTLEQLPPSPHFVFDSMRNDAAIGMDQIIQAPEDGWILPYERYPFATCELGAGLQPTHHRRMIVSAQDAYALSLVKLGSGNNLVGYYMYHGGINKIGELSTFNESRASGYPNDCPILSYFEHTAISSYGETGETYRKLNLLHLFLHDFGSQLAPLPYVASQVHPKPEDTCTLRYAMRTDGSKGFVFVNQYQRLHKMKPLEDVRLDTGSVQFPVLKITDGASFILPFNIPLGNVKLRYATAQLLCRTGDTWFFTEIEGNSPEYCLDGEIYRPEQLPDVHRVKDSCIVTLPKEQALYLRKLHGSVFLGDQCDLYWMDEQIHAVQPGSFSYMEWNGTHFIHQEQRKEYVPAQLEETSLKDLAFLPPYWDELQLNGPRKVLCKKISVTTPEGFVEISDVCDAAQIYANGVLAADEYYCGVPWRIPANLLYGKECYLFLSEIKNDFYREF